MTLSPKARNVALFAAVACAALILPDLAHAQVGGGSGVVNSLTQWFMTNVARGLVMLGIIAVAIGLFVMRFSVSVIASVVAGGLILANADTIAGYFGF
ncbi:TrbC/VirB2 family protein [Roseomonas gilardii]|uniref:TrbC/VirB2 family protein n=1 Tax=Roseomonas gilardii TaxID=257708 RepID=UPI0011A5D072|nr:TrbC/VirB2 family protein [Roseomonas gilardii]